MKTVLASIALSVVSAVSFAKAAPAASDTLQPAVQYIFQGDTLAPAFTSPLTKMRAEVIAELKDSQANMDYVFMGDTWVPRSVFMSERSVAEVRAEAARYHRRAALRAGLESRH